ncbi:MULTISPECIES: hypothetical protein [Pseudomonas]|uniref:hypothetical protein n=1 Tax=Pseudomonas TaxID=286 RepID=UPI001F527242|nr:MULTISPECIES: hypothetical protein [Pseudomonas]
MKTVRLYLITVLFIGAAYAEPPKSILGCPLSDGTRVSLLAESTAEGQRLFLELDQKTQTAFTDMPDTDFVGQVVLAKCISSGFIFALNYGSPYLKGVVLRKNPVSHSIERTNRFCREVPAPLALSWTRANAVGHSKYRERGPRKVPGL